MPELSKLQPYIKQWGQETAAARLQRRVDADLEELHAFYDAVSPYLEEIIQHLNAYSVDEIPEADKPLAYLALALCETDDAIHNWQAANLDYISDPVTWRTKTAFTDYQ